MEQMTYKKGRLPGGGVEVEVEEVEEGGDVSGGRVGRGRDWTREGKGRP